jgi:uncharacterized OB-fold protein
MAEVSGFICKGCGRRSYVHHAQCWVCKGTAFEAAALKGRARLLTFTRVHMLSLAYTDRFITLGIVEFEDGCRALGRLLVDEPEVGMELDLEIGVVRQLEHEEIRGLCFRKAGSAQHTLKKGGA